MSTYKDRLIECTESHIAIRGYYFPWGTKSIPCESIQSVERFSMTALRGKWRIWGSGNLKHWANLDTRRPTKDVGFLIDLGRHVIPVLTPDDPGAFEAVLKERGISISQR